MTPPARPHETAGPRGPGSRAADQETAGSRTPDPHAAGPRSTEASQPAEEAAATESSGSGALTAAPAVAVELLGASLPRMVRYAEALATTGVSRGLVGPREVPRLWSRHIVNCALLAPLLPPGSRVVDVGSGAGLPGLVLALARPDLDVVLLEPMLRRVTWLQEVVDDLAVSNAQVLRGRAEDVRGRVHAPFVTARAVAPLDRLGGWALPLLEPEGELLALKGRSAGAELTAAAPSLRRSGAVAWRVEEVQPAGVEDPLTVVRVRVGPAAPRRRSGRSSSSRRPHRGTEQGGR